MKQRVWSLRKLKDIMRQLYGVSEPTQVEAQTLSQKLWQDRHLGYAETAPFTGPYILVRDMSEQYKPIMQKQWPAVKRLQDGEWPQWRITRPGRCPFVRDLAAERAPQQSVTAVHPERDGQYQQVVANGGHVNASGMHQMTSAIQSTIHSASNNKENNNSALLASLHKKAITAKRAMAKPSPGGSRPAPLAVRAATVPNQHHQHQQDQQKQNERTGAGNQAKLDPTDSKKIKVVENRDGYCENCRVKFADFQQHLRTSQHQQYANNPENFRELDALLQSLQRMPRQDLCI